MAIENIDFNLISKALNQTFQIMKTEDACSEMAIRNLEKANDQLNDAMRFVLEKDLPAI